THRAGRPLPRRELRAGEPVDELRPAGVPSAAGDLDGDLHRGGRGACVGPRRPADSSVGSTRQLALAPAPRMRRPRIGRRAFLGSLAAGWALVAPRVARAEDVFTVGLVLPAETETATEMSRGAAIGLEDANALATLFGKRLRLDAGRASAGTRAPA